MAINSFLLISSLFVLVVGNANAESSLAVNTTESQSPVHIANGNNNSSKITYINKTVVGKERIGKKLAIRIIYLIPTYQMVFSQTDFYETSFIYVELQSIWPEPVLLTAARISITPPSSSIHMKAGMSGGAVLASQITQNENPSQFLFKPGEVKFIGLSQGIKLDGVLDFFKGEIINETVWADMVPALIPNFARVTELNHFLRQRFGKTTTIRISFFEKDYRPVLTADVKLGEGGDLFSHGDVSTSSYQLKHDAFIGEVLYQLKGGTEYFEHRRAYRINATKEALSQ